MNWIKFVSLSILIFSFCLANGQGKITIGDSYAEKDVKISKQDYKIYKDSAARLVNDFQKYLKFEDSDKTSFLMFKKLFRGSPSFLNFFRDKPVVVSISEFETFAWDVLRKNGGADFDYEYAELESVKINPSQDVEMVLKINLKVYKVYDKNGKLIVIKDGRKVQLQANIILDPKNGNEARFIGLTPKSEKTNKLNSFTSLSAGAFYMAGAIQSTPVFIAGEGGFLEGKPSVKSLGLSANFNKSFTRDFALWASLQLEKTDIEMSFNSDTYSGTIGGADDVDDVSYRYYSASNFTEATSSASLADIKISDAVETLNGVTRITGSLGVRYMKNIGTNDRLLAGIGISPSFMLATSDGERQVEFTGYIIPDLDDFPSLEELEANQILESYGVNKNLSVNKVSMDSKVSLSGVASVTYQKQIGFKWGLELTGSYIRGISSALNAKGYTTSGLLRQTSLLEEYFTNQRMHGIQFQVGIFYKLNESF